MLEKRRALECLEALQLRAGDVVVEWRRSDLRKDDELDPQRLRLVASIADDGTVCFQGGGGRRARVDRLDLQTGKRTLWKELIPSDPAGVETIGPIMITPDAKTCIFGYHRMLADLYLVEGLK